MKKLWVLERKLHRHLIWEPTTEVFLSRAKAREAARLYYWPMPIPCQYVYRVKPWVREAK